MADFAAIRFQPSRPLLRELSADRLNSILAEIRRNKPLPGRGITVRQTGQGTAIDLAASVPRGGTPIPRQPWDLIARVDPDADPEDENPPYLVSVQPGTVARVLADNWDYEFTGIQRETLYFGIARVTTDGTYITSVTLDLTDEPPAPQEAVKFGLAEEIDLLFGLFKDGAAYNVVGEADLSVVATNVAVAEADPPAAPGEAMFEVYYRLQ